MNTMIPIHIQNICAGDTVFHNGTEHTVSGKDIKYDSFMGISLFGDSYRLGTKPVMKVIFDTPKIPLTLISK